MSSAADEKDAIRELMARYAQNLDAGRFADVASLFTEDAVWTTTYGTANGRAEIEAMFEHNVPKKGEGPQRKHYITNIIIKLDGDTASAVSDYLVVREAENGLLPCMGGRTGTRSSSALGPGNSPARSCSTTSSATWH